MFHDDFRDFNEPKLWRRMDRRMEHRLAERSRCNFAFLGLGVVATFLLNAAASYVISYAISAVFAKKPQAPQASLAHDPVTRTVTIRQPAAPRRIVLGEVRTAGVITHFETTSDNRILHLVVTLAGHVVSAICDVQFDEIVVPLDAPGTGGGGPDGANALGSYTNLVYIGKHDGSGTAQPFPALVAQSAKWLATHKQIGCAKVYAQIIGHRDVFPNGMPNLTAILRGALAYDPRTGLTVWTSNVALLMVWFLTHPTLGLKHDYDDEIDETLLIAAANICDEEVLLAAGQTTTITAVNTTLDTFQLPAGMRPLRTGDGVRFTTDGELPGGLAAGTTYYAIVAAHSRYTIGIPHSGLYQVATSLVNARADVAIDLTSAGTGAHTLTYYSEPRYTCNGMFESNISPKELLGRLKVAMAGHAVRVGGKWRIYAGAWLTPGVTLDEGAARGSIQVRPRISGRELFNGVKGVCITPANRWQPSDFPVVTNALYLAEDGGERSWLDMDLPFTTASATAQRLAKIELERARQQITATQPCKLSAYLAEPPQTLSLTNTVFGWSAKAFETAAARLVVDRDANGAPYIGVDLTLRETVSTVFDWSSGEETVVDPAPDTDLPSPFEVEAPGIVSVTEALYETTGSSKVKATVTWMELADPFVSEYQLEYKLASETNWTVITNIRAGSFDILDIAPGAYNFRLKAINVLGASSDYSTANKEILGLLALPANVSGFSVTASNGFAYCSWNLAADSDVKIGGRVVIRHSPSGTDWNEGIILREFDGNSVSGIVALITGTYFAKFVDASGNYSETAASFVVTEGMVTGFTTVGTLTEDPTFAGTKTNVVVSGAVLQLSGGTLFDSVAGNFDDAAGNFDAFGGQATSGNYLFGPLDLATVAVRRFEADIDAAAFDNGDLFDEHQGNFDDADGLFDGDGEAINDANVALYAALTDDDPSGAPTWGDWFPFHVGDFNSRAAKFRLDFTVGTPAHNIAVSELVVHAKIPV